MLLKNDRQFRARNHKVDTEEISNKERPQRSSEAKNTYSCQQKQKGYLILTVATPGNK